LLKEMAIKEQRVAEFLRREQLGALVLTRVPAIVWVTAGLFDPRRNLTTEASPIWLLLTSAGGKFVIGPSSEMTRLVDEDLNDLGYEARPYPWASDPRLQIVRDLANRQPIGADAPLDGARTVDIAPLRYALTDTEVKKYEEAGRAAGIAVEEAMRRIRPAMSELEIEALTADELRTHGLEPVEILVGADERALEYRFPTPGRKRVKKLAMVAVSARRWGLTASLARLVSFGPPSADLVRTVRAMASVNAHLQDATRAGVRAERLVPLLVGWYSDVGFSEAWDRHDPGGATGYAVHDWVLKQGTPEIIQPQQAFAWSPGVGGVKAVDTIVAWPDRIENLTATATWPAIKTVIGKFTYTSPDVLVVGGAPP
jgi:antitoxin VapB